MRLVLLILCLIKATKACQGGGPKGPQYFSTDGWGGWKPPDDSWKKWVELYGKNNNSVAFDSTEVGKDAASGWPSYWKGIGKGNSGVPPPPWAYIPDNYGRPQFCYLQPAQGHCNLTLSRWGFNPTSSDCQQFTYSGCGGNLNNFMNPRDCKKACGQKPDTDCDWDTVVE